MAQMSLFLIGGTNVTFYHRWHKCHAMLLVAQMSHSYYRWHKCRSGRNVMVGQMSGGTNVGRTNVGRTKVAPPCFLQKLSWLHFTIRQDLENLVTANQSLDKTNAFKRFKVSEN